MIDILHRACRLVILAVALLAGIALAGDEDTKPAYMIYIDPETGKYTTEDPEAGKVSDRVVPANSVSGVPEPEFPARIVGVVALAVLVVGGLIALQRKQHMR